MICIVAGELIGISWYCFSLDRCVHRSCNLRVSVNIAGPRKTTVGDALDNLRTQDRSVTVEVRDFVLDLNL